MQLQFPEIFDFDKGKTGFVLGLGSSLRKNLDMLRKLHNDKYHYKIISCNNMDIMTDINFDYWMLAQPADISNPFCIQNSWERYNARKNTLFLYTDCLDLTPRKWVADHLTINYIGYDQRHWGGEHCTWGDLPQGQHICCERIIKERKCIQEYLMQYTKVNYHYGAADTVGVHMVALAVMLGLNPIYITGIDLDYTNGYVNNDIPTIATRLWMGNSVMKDEKMVERILRDLESIRTAAENIGVKIYDLDGGGRIANVFEHKNFNLN